LKNMEDNSIDSIITDPPYNLIKSNSGFERGKDSPYTRTAKGGKKGKVLFEIAKKDLGMCKE